MDFKKIVNQVKDAAEDLKEKAETKIKEVRDSLDKDHDTTHRVDPDIPAGTQRRFLPRWLKPASR